MNEVTILGRGIKIKVVSQKEVGVRSGDAKTVGFFVGEEDTVYLSRTLNEESKRRVLLHELFHAALHICGVSNLLKEKHEEAICDVAESFYELFKNEVFVKHMNQRRG